MSVEKIEALVVGAGQAGVAMSEHLTRCGVPHLVPSEARHLDDPEPPASPRADQRS